MAMPENDGPSAKQRHTTRRYEEIEAELINEETSLLGSSDSGEEAAQPLARKGSWDGLDDFRSEPRWRVPSVCCLLPVDRCLDFSPGPMRTAT